MWLVEMCSSELVFLHAVRGTWNEDLQETETRVIYYTTANKLSHSLVGAPQIRVAARQINLRV